MQMWPSRGAASTTTQVCERKGLTRRWPKLPARMPTAVPAPIRTNRQKAELWRRIHRCSTAPPPVRSGDIREVLRVVNRASGSWQFVVAGDRMCVNIWENAGTTDILVRHPKGAGEGQGSHGRRGPNVRQHVGKR